MTFQEASLRLLIVDDNVAVHDHFRQILCAPSSTHAELDALEGALFGTAVERTPQKAFEIDSAFQGTQAIEMVHAALAAGRPYALAFVDIRMPPGLDGIETLSRMWQADPRLQAVICTAYSDHTWDDIVRRLGPSDGVLVLRKPFDPIEALQLAHALTRKWNLAREVEHQLRTLEQKVEKRTLDLRTTNARLADEVAQRTQAEAHMEYLARHDSLTGLPNRVLLHDRLSTALARADRHRTSVAVLLLDLDDFKDVNDCLGHDAGDALLREIALRLRQCGRTSDTVARLGGDEFVIVLEEIAEPEDAAIVAQRVLARCTEPLEVAGQAVHTPPSIGIALYPGDGSDAAGLLKCADLAMYQAKEDGGARFAYYARSMMVSSMERVQLRDQLERALSGDQFELWYQPILDLCSGQIRSMEALLRWRHPELGLVPPLKFIPAAEKCGLIMPLGRWVIETACQQLATWHGQGRRDLTVAVNVSAHQLRSHDFVASVKEALQRAGIAPATLELEITESAAMEDFELARRVLRELAALGVRIAIDDFGAGHSSLLRLKELPIHTLKIDRMFVKDIVSDRRDAAIVAGMIGMAHALGLNVVAEGIEHAEQLHLLSNLEWNPRTKLQCERVQGYLMSKPLPADEAGSLLTNTTTPWWPRPRAFQATGS